MQNSRPKRLKFLKLFAFIIIALELLAGILSAVFVYKNSQDTTKNIVSTSNALLNNISAQVDNSLSQYSRQLENPDFPKELFDIIENKEHLGNFKYETSLRSVLENLATSNVGINSVGFVDCYGKSIGYNMPFDQLNEIFDFAKVQKDALGGKSKVYSYYENDHKTLIMFKRMFYVDSQYNIYYVGDMIISLNEESALGKCFYFEDIDSSNFYACDDNLNILSSNKKEEIGLNFGDIYKLQDENTAKFKNTDEIFALTKSISNQYNVTTVALYSKKQLHKVLIAPTFYIIFIVLICFLASIFIIFVFADLNKQDSKNYKMEIMLKEAQIASYESQINPHFLYNALQMIQMMGIVHDFDGVQNAPLYLGEVLRYSLNKQKEVLISTELENINYYFSLVKLRYRDRFDYSIDIKDEIQNCKMLKFILQPIVENAVKHGIEKVEHNGEVKILARIFDHTIILIVRDNGVGIEKDKLKEIQDVLDGKSENSNIKLGIGLKNVNERIKLFYGEQYGIKIISKYGVKTDVMITIPIDTIGDDDDVQNDYS